MDNTECDITKCKNVTLEIGRFISELSLKSIAQPEPMINSEEDISRLGNLVTTFRNRCSIKKEDMERINKFSLELKNISPTAKGTRLVQPLSDIMREIYSARSECDCKNK